MISGDVEEYIVDPLLSWVRGSWGNGFFADSAAIRGYAQWTEHQLGAQVIRAALELAEERGYVAGVHDKYADSYYSLTDAGVAYLDNKMSRPQTVLGKLSIFGEPWVRSALARIVREKDEKDILGGIDVAVPASDRTVTLDHNQPDYEDAVDALDKVLEEFWNDHRLDNEDKEGKDAITKILEGGRRFLDREEITVEQADSWLLKPLKWILGKFTEGTLQAAAAKALELVCKLVGLVS